MPAMEWRVHPRFPEYEISECGDVRRTVASRTRRAGHRPKGCINEDGYLAYYLTDARGDKVSVTAHRLVIEAFVGPSPSPAHEVTHEDGSRINCHRSNLRWATRQSNHADIQLHGTAPRGERNGRATIDEAMALRILGLRGQKKKSRIARDLGVAPSVVYHLLSGRTWQHLPRTGRAA